MSPSVCDRSKLSPPGVGKTCVRVGVRYEEGYSVVHHTKSAYEAAP